MLVHDLEFAVAHVPAQKDMTYLGMVNQEACMHLLVKMPPRHGRVRQG